MKTYKEFCEQSGFMKPEAKQVFDPKTNTYKTLKPGSLGYELNSRAISDPAYNTYRQTGRMPRGLDAIRTYRPLRSLPGGDLFKTGGTPLASRVMSGVRMGSTIGLGLQSGQVLANLATKFGNWRRQQQQQRLNQLVPGNTSVSGKPAEIKPLNK